MSRMTKVKFLLLFLTAVGLSGCQQLVQDTKSFFVPSFHRSDVFGFLAGFGTTFAALPDLLAMLRRRSAAGMNTRMAAIMCVFQILWVYYGLLIQSKPVVLWNVVAIFINSLNVAAYLYFVNKEKGKPATR